MKLDKKQNFIYTYFIKNKLTKCQKINKKALILAS
jgi:hypothetical protein